MGSTGKAFDEVKAILGKLDRSIDDARTKRLGPDEPDPSENSGEGADQLIGKADDSGETVVGQSKSATPVPNAAPARARPASEYGRARPLRREHDNAANPTGQWDKNDKAGKAKPQGPVSDDTVIG